MSGKLRINGKRLLDNLFELGKLGRDYVVGKMKALGMSIRVDEIGNVTGVYAGETDLPPVMIGSHIDTVGTGGLYDGNYGVLSGLEVVATLKDAGIRPHRPVAVTFFTNKEGVRFQPDMMGSVVWSKQYPLADALAAKDLDGISVGEALATIGYKGEAKTGDFAVDSYLELHIEQGPILDKNKINIGVVTGVQGISWNEYTIKGVTNHAGTTPMSMRHDAGLVATKIATYAREISKTLGGNQVATVGYIDFKPNLINVIPDHAVVTIDLRNTDNELLKQAEKMLHDYALAAAKEEGTEISYRSLVRFNPVVFAAEIVGAVEAEAKAQGFSNRHMPSGAGHDAQFMAGVCPAEMIFVPCKDGISHNVTEYSAPEDLENGANVLPNVVYARAMRQ
ncbi:Zn-dependent hydrolase [Cardiobacterium valvarum]|uniref:Putative N-carbamyl-L-cysteine amidohydrolase n=1 Tax=Cardiobacterium valvarum F0432 TaxID=797473 RepID=G9ZDF3_9GAMM|nr:Zn-dependent hydrolase [Cardiobacterium valvarum]EHM55279.1 putative N-carbamyl-L-cysteine amidohydrolase [Cardiobacterium valvarum F0432]